MTMRGACERIVVPLEHVEDIIAGCVNPAHEGNGRRRPMGCPGRRLPRQCLRRHDQPVLRFVSERDRISHAIMAGDLNLGIACGVESMSRSGWAFMKGDSPFSPRGASFPNDTMWAGAGGPPNPTLLAHNAHISMIETAQNVGDRYGLTRTEIDEFALRSQRRAAAARTLVGWPRRSCR